MFPSPERSFPRHSRRRDSPASRGVGSAARVVEPGFDLARLEAEQMPPLEIGDASFGDEAADVADLNAEASSDLVDVPERLDGVDGHAAPSRRARPSRRQAGGGLRWSTGASGHR